MVQNNGCKTQQYLLKHEPALVETFHFMYFPASRLSHHCQLKKLQNICKTLAIPANNISLSLVWLSFSLTDFKHWSLWRFWTLTAIRTLRCCLDSDLTGVLCAANFFHASELLASSKEIQFYAKKLSYHIHLSKVCFVGETPYLSIYFCMYVGMSECLRETLPFQQSFYKHFYLYSVLHCSSGPKNASFILRDAPSLLRTLWSHGLLTRQISKAGRVYLDVPAS